MVLLLLTTVFFFNTSTYQHNDLVQEATIQEATTSSVSGTESLSFMQHAVHEATVSLAEVRRKKIAWGAYAGDSVTDDALFETLVGRKMDLRPVFVGWNDPFPSAFGPTVRDNGKTLVVFWEQYGVTLDEIINGKADAYIVQFAESVRVYDGPVMLVPFHEMNGNWDPWDGTAVGNTPAKVISAWKHIHDRFRTVQNVKFAWDVNNGSVPDTPTNAITLYYPGDLYVDYVAVDGFNDGDPEQSWSEVFAPTLEELKRYQKPIYILSMATAQSPRKAAWITDALTVQIPKHKEIVGWVWFNQNKEQDWRVSADANALAAFKAGLPK
jgi:hypothetical protein